MYHRNLIGNQLFLFQYRLTFPQTFFLNELQYNALPQDYLRRWNQNYPDHQLVGTLKTILEPFLPLHHKLNCPHEDDIYLKPHQPLLQISCELYLIINLIHALHTELFYGRV